jgi:hypothetical protein
VTRLKSESTIKSLRIDTGMMLKQLDEIAAARARFRYGPAHKLLANAATTALRGYSHVLD